MPIWCLSMLMRISPAAPCNYRVAFLSPQNCPESATGLNGASRRYAMASGHPWPRPLPWFWAATRGRPGCERRDHGPWSGRQ
jgi:hypothetical protein